MIAFAPVLTTNNTPIKDRAKAKVVVQDLLKHAVCHGYQAVRDPNYSPNSNQLGRAEKLLNSAKELNLDPKKLLELTQAGMEVGKNEAWLQKQFNIKGERRPLKDFFNNQVHSLVERAVTMSGTIPVKVNDLIKYLHSIIKDSVILEVAKRRALDD